MSAEELSSDAPSSLRSRWKRATWNASASAGFCVAVWYLLLPLLLNSNYVAVDLPLTDLGNFCELRRWLSSGGSPGISRYLGVGQPLFADAQVALLYPPRFLSLFFSPEFALFFQVAFHLGLGAMSLGLLLKSFRVGPRAIFVSALGYGLMGLSVDYIGHSVFIIDFLWVPLFWLFLREGLTSKSAKSAARAALGGAASLTFLLLGGEPQGLIFCLILFLIQSGAWVLAGWVRRSKRPQILRRILLFGMALVGGILLSSVQWLPTWMEMKVTFRSATVDLSQSLAQSFGPGNWLSSLIPGFLEPTLSYGGWFRHFFNSSPGSTVWTQNNYLGGLALGLAAFGVASAIRRRRERSIVILAVVSLLFSLGSETTFLPLLYRWFSPLARFRYPEKYLLLLDLSIWVLASLGFHRLRKSSQQRAFFWALTTLGFFYLVGLAWLKGHETSFDRSLSNVFQALGAGGSLEGPRVLVDFAFDSMLRGAIPVLVLIALYVRRPLVYPVLGFLLVADLAFSNFASLPLGQEPYTFGAADQSESWINQLRSKEKQVPVTAADLSQEVTCLSGDFRSALPFENGQDHLSLSAVMKFRKLSGFPQINACAGYRASPSYSLLIPAAASYLIYTKALDRHLRWARALGCTAMASLIPLEPKLSEGVVPQTFDVAYETGSQKQYPVHVYRIPNPVQPIEIITHPFWVSDRYPNWLSYFDAPDWEPQPKLAMNAFETSPLKNRADRPPLPSGDQAKLTDPAHLSPDRIEFSLEGRGGAVVAFRQAFAVGWKAMQNGKELETVSRLGQFLSVIVPDVSAGPVQLSYQIPRLFEGALLSLFGLSIMMLSFGLLYRKG